MASKKNSRTTTGATTTTKKAAPRKKVTTVKESTSPIVAASTVKSSSDVSRSLALNRKYVIIGLLLLLVVGVLYLVRSFFIAALVNGQPISRFTVIAELEKQSGRQALDTLVTKTLILQEARKQNVVVADSEVNAEMKRIEENVKKQGQTLDQVLELQGMDKNMLTDQIRIQQTVEKILGKDISVSDKEVQEYIEKNKEALGENAESAETKTQVKEQLTQQKLSDKFQTWLQDLKKNAKINYFVGY